MNKKIDYIQLWFYLVAIFSILILLFQIVYNYDKDGPFSYKYKLNKQITDVMRYIVPEKALHNFKDGEFSF